MVMHATKYPRLEVGYQGHNDKPRLNRSENNSRYNASRLERRLSPTYKNEKSSSRSPRYPSKPRDLRLHKERNRSNHIRPEKDRCRSTETNRQENSSPLKESDHKRKIKDDSRKVAIRYCGDWTEQKSLKTNRIYYFNTTTEESKWEKPPEWDDARSKKVDQATSATNQTSSIQRRNNSQASTSSRSYSSDEFDDLDKTYKFTLNAYQNEILENFQIIDFDDRQSTCSNLSLSNRHQPSNSRPADYHRNGPSRRQQGNNDIDTRQQRRDVPQITTISTVPPSQSKYNLERFSRKSEKDSRLSDEKIPINRPVETDDDDMDISPTSSDCSPKSTENSVHSSRRGRKAMQAVLTKLQEALTKTVKSPEVHEGSNSIRKHQSPPASTNGHISNRYIDDYESPNDDCSDKVSRTSSVPPDSPDRINMVDALNSQLPPAKGSLSKLLPRVNNGTTLPTLPTNLAQFYKESLICHIKNWPSEYYENESWRLGGELLHLKDNNSQVSVDLKQFRSAVRLANVQATLKEQRIIFLQKLQKDIEDMKCDSDVFNTSLPS